MTKSTTMKLLKKIMTFFCIVGLLCFPTFEAGANVENEVSKEKAKSSEEASKSKDSGRAKGFIWLTLGGTENDDNSTYGRSYQDVENEAKVSKLELRFLNDDGLYYHMAGQDLGSLNSRYHGIAYIGNRFKLDLDGGRISHSTNYHGGFRTQRDWIEFKGLVDIHKFLTFSFAYEGYDYDGFSRYNFLRQEFSSMEFALNYLRSAWSGRAFYRRGDFEQPLFGYDQHEMGYFVGRRFRHDQDHISISYERGEISASRNPGGDLESHYFSGVYVTNPHPQWTLRGSFRGNVQDNRVSSIFGEDTFTRTADLDVAYHGFKKVRAKARIRAHNVDRYSRRGMSTLADTESTSYDFRFSNKGKCPLNWSFKFSYKDQDGSNFQHIDHATPDSMDFYMGNSFQRTRAAFSASRPFNKGRLLVGCNLLRDWTSYDNTPGIGLDDYHQDSAMLDLTWFASDKLSLGVGAGGMVTDLRAWTRTWHTRQARNLLDTYVSRDHVYSFNLGYTIDSKTRFSADLLNTANKSDGYAYPVRFGEFEQRYEIERRVSNSARIGFRYTDSHYVERIYGLEDGRVKRWDLDYRIIF